MKTIWKFEVPVDGSIHLPFGAEILQVREQGEHVCLWALVDPNALLQERRFMLIGTGHPVPANVIHRGTAHFHGGALVLHVFEVLV